MQQSLSTVELRSLGFLCGQNAAMHELVAALTARQAGSVRWHARALDSLSGAASQLPFAAPVLPLCVERAAGARIRDVDGHEYIDCHMAYTASILGHNPPYVADAVRQALDRGLGAGHFFREQALLAEVVRELAPGLERVALFHSGGEAIAAAVRLARAATGRTMVAKFEGCYHGWTDIGVYNTMMILSGRVPTGPLDDIPPQAATAGVSPGPGAELVILPFNSPVAFEVLRRRADELACVVVDPVPPFMSTAIDQARAFVVELRRVTAELGVPLLLDEVVTGFRLARGGAQQAFDVQGDLVGYGKITSGLGVPLTLVGGAARFLDRARTDGLFADYRAGKAWVSSTNAGNFLAVVASLAALRHLAEHHDDLTARLDRNHAHLRQRLQEFARRTGIPVSLQGHPRLQSFLALDAHAEGESTYRAIMGRASPWSIRPLLALTLYLRMRGVYAKTVPTMNLSAAHTEADVAAVADAVEHSLLQMRADGVLPA